MKGTAYPSYPGHHGASHSPPVSLFTAPEVGTNLRWVDWIWHIRGSVEVPSELSDKDALDRLEPLFHEAGTDHERASDTLYFRKKDQAAQDKMSVFSDGVLRIEDGDPGRVLRYNLTSRALLFCFLAPLMFLGIAQFTMVIGQREKAAAEAADKAGKAPKEKKKAETPMNPIDKFLGAPAPKTAAEKKKDKAEGKKKGLTPTPAYVFAGIFAALYLIGRILEDRLIKSLFRKRLLNM